MNPKIYFYTNKYSFTKFHDPHLSILPQIQLSLKTYNKLLKNIIFLE
jgi:hypothetical protein